MRLALAMWVTLVALHSAGAEEYKPTKIDDILIDGKEMVGIGVSVTGTYVKISGNDTEWLAAGAGVNMRSYVSPKKIYLLTEDADRDFRQATILHLGMAIDGSYGYATNIAIKGVISMCEFTTSAGADLPRQPCIKVVTGKRVCRTEQAQINDGDCE